MGARGLLMSSCLCSSAVVVDTAPHSVVTITAFARLSVPQSFRNIMRVSSVAHPCLGDVAQIQDKS